MNFNLFTLIEINRIFILSFGVRFRKGCSDRRTSLKNRTAAILKKRCFEFVVEYELSCNYDQFCLLVNSRANINNIYDEYGITTR